MATIGQVGVCEIWVLSQNYRLPIAEVFHYGN